MKKINLSLLIIFGISAALMGMKHSESELSLTNKDVNQIITAAKDVFDCSKPGDKLFGIVGDPRGDFLLVHTNSASCIVLTAQETNNFILLHHGEKKAESALNDLMKNKKIMSFMKSRLD